MRTLERPQPITITAAAVSAVAAVMVLVDDSWRAALLVLVAVVVIAATRVRFAPLVGALLATIVAALALSGHGPTLDPRSPQAQAAPVPHHHPARVHHHPARH